MPDDTLKYTKFDNFLMAEIMQGKYSQTETRVLLAIIRQTAGFHRSSATISSAQLDKYRCAACKQSSTKSDR